jgi:hypothetical protein
MQNAPEKMPAPAPSRSEASLMRCSDYLERIHYWIRLWSVLTLIGFVIMFFSLNS